jgi:hypothetical protein
VKVFFVLVFLFAFGYANDSERSASASLSDCLREQKTIVDRKTNEMCLKSYPDDKKLRKNCFETVSSTAFVLLVREVCNAPR